MKLLLLITVLITATIMFLISADESKDIAGPFSAENEVLRDSPKTDKAAVPSIIERMHAENPGGAMVVEADQPDTGYDEKTGLKQ
jgi:hypothetical protein